MDCFQVNLQAYKPKFIQNNNQQIVNMKQMTFNWFPCNVTENTSRAQSQCLIGLEKQASIVINLNEQISDMEIQLKKPFLIEDKVGWVWHKSWLIPEIQICLDDFLWKLLKQKNLTAHLKAQLMAVVQNSTKTDNFKLMGLDRDTKKPLINRNAIFNNFKFKQTSFHNMKKPFRLLVSVFVQEGNKKDMLAAAVSSLIYVDSRRQARGLKTEKKWEMTTKLQIEQFFQPLKKASGNKHVKISSGVNGFIDYYTSQNIRNKVKNPFFIAYHFGLGCSCYFNIYSAYSPLNALRIIEGGKTEDNVLLLLFQTDDIWQKQKIEHIANKLLFMKGVVIETRNKNEQFDLQEWESISRKKLGQTYKKYYNRDFQEQKAYSINTNQTKTDCWKSEITIQIGGPRKMDKKSFFERIECKLEQNDYNN